MTKLLLSAVAAALLLAQPAAAQEVSLNAKGERTAIVRYSDLDLSRAEGADRLMRRIERAVDKVCAVEHVSRLTLRAEFEECKRAATQKAVAQVNAPLLFAAFEARRG